MGELLAGKAMDAQVAALLVALHMKGETVEEIVAFAKAIAPTAQPLSNTNGTALDVNTERDADCYQQQTTLTASSTLPQSSRLTSLCVTNRICS